MSDLSHPPWTVIEGGPLRVSVGQVEVVLATRDQPPFGVDALIYEEDSFLVLSAPARLEEPGESPLRVLTAAHETEAVSPGQVVVREGPPLRLLAVVHDLSQSPSCHPDWIATALGEALRQVELRHLSSAALPLLGTGHSTFSWRQAAALLHEALGERRGSLKRVWLQLPEGQDHEVWAALGGQR